MGSIKDYTGLRIGSLVAVQRLPNYCKSNTFYICKCDCGKEIKIPQTWITSHKINSCGKCVAKTHTGEIYGSLTVVEEYREEKQNRLYFKCKCACGCDYTVFSGKLFNGQIRACRKCRDVRVDRRKDIIGQKFGKLTVVEMLYRYNGKRTYCRCQCECGNETIVSLSSVTGQSTRSCGCILEELRHSRKHFKPLIGKRFGRLLVTGMINSGGTGGSAIWECICDCGNKCNYSTNELTNYGIVSCGCELKYGQNIDISGMKYGHLTVLSKCESRNRSLSWWLCECSCGKKIKADARSLIEGLKISCGCITYSIFEELVASVLHESKIEYIRQHSFKECRYKYRLKFDFWVPQKNLLIEADGEQHNRPVKKFGGHETFVKTLKRDSIKNEYCRLNGINLLRIPYTTNKQDIQQQLSNYINPVTITA